MAKKVFGGGSTPTDNENNVANIPTPEQAAKTTMDLPSGTVSKLEKHALLRKSSKALSIINVPEETRTAFEAYCTKNKVSSREGLALLLISAGYPITDLRELNPSRKGLHKFT